MAIHDIAAANTFNSKQGELRRFVVKGGYMRVEPFKRKHSVLSHTHLNNTSTLLLLLVVLLSPLPCCPPLLQQQRHGPPIHHEEEERGAGLRPPPGDVGRQHAQQQQQPGFALAKLRHVPRPAAVSRHTVTHSAGLGPDY